VCDDGSREHDGSKSHGSPPPAPNWGLAVELGFRLGVAVVMGLGGGLLIDNWLRTTPVFTLIGMVVGIGAAMATIWRVASNEMRR
jgi:F0F1-type ATP synthase assembly protein I